MDIIQKDACTPCPPEATAMAEQLYNNNPAVLGVLFYGSGLWKKIEEDTVLDFYVIVDSFKSYGSPLTHRFWGTLLPPNVYYVEHTKGDKTLRCKYAVMTYAQFYAAAKGLAIAPSIWARFSQPCRLVLSKNSHAKEKLLTALHAANTTFHKRTLPHLKHTTLTAKVLWEAGLKETYQCELRSEKKGRNSSIYEAQATHFNLRTQLFSNAYPNWLSPEGENYKKPPFLVRHTLAFLNTPLRRYSGKLITLLRLLKAPLTFTGAVSYIIWKIERHSGVKLEATPFQHKYPLIGAWPLLFKVLTKKIAR